MLRGGMKMPRDSTATDRRKPAKPNKYTGPRVYWRLD